MKKLLPFLMLLSLFLCTCTTGLGEEIDLEAPEITITSPKKNSYQKLHIEFKGTCSDNKGVTNVTITNKETGKFYGYANVKENNWNFIIDLQKEEEDEITFLCTANDAFGNSSTKSARTITLLVDEHAPEGLSWYVDRGNSKQIDLKKKEELESLDLNFSVNKDIPQNQKFTLYGNFYDAMSIDYITVNLYDEAISTTTPILTKTVSADENNTNFIGEGKSIYSPSFTFDSGDSDFPEHLKTGKHYLRVKYSARDNDTENGNETVDENGDLIDIDTEGYIYWYPESDKPGIQQIQIDAKGKISASVGSSIPIDFFDDDGLVDIRYALKKTSKTNEEVINDIDSLFNDSKDEPAKTKTSYTNKQTTDDPVELTAPTTPGQMYLITYAKDINDKENARVIPVEITDENKPLLFIEKPTENEIPVMKEGSTDTFTFTGYSLDTKGSKYIAVVYNPTGETSEENIKNLVNTNLENLKLSKKIIDSTTKSVIWYKEFSDGKNRDGWVEQSFTIDMLLNDFKDENGNSTVRERKVLEILLVDNDGNIVYKPFVINGDSGQPVVNIQEPSKELEVIDYTQKGVSFKFKGEKQSGIGMNPDEYIVKTTIDKTTYTYSTTSDPKITVDAQGWANLTIPKETLKDWSTTEAQPTFTFFAKDTLGNGGEGENGEGQGQRSIILSPRPSINEITINKNTGKYKQGEVLTFKVSFTKQVKVTGTPKLKLKYSSLDNSYKYATYSSGSGSNALLFTFTVPENAESDGIICEGFETVSENTFAEGIRIQATELGEADVYTSIDKEKILKNKKIALDGKKPFINRIYVQDPDETGAYTAGKELTAVMECSESVLVSGTPELSLVSGGKALMFNFKKMVGTDIYFTHTITTNDGEGEISYNTDISKANPALSTTSASYLKDEVGNSFALTSKIEGTTGIEIDYTAPTTTPSINLTKDSYNTNQVLELTSTETGAKLYYSKNGGVSWDLYDPTETSKLTLTNGSYKIVTRQSDRAGNMSNNSATKNITINSKFAPISAITVDLGDGNYKEGTEFTFTLDFEEAVNVKSEDDITLKYKSSKDSTKTKTIKVSTITDETTSVKFKDTVGSTDYFDGIEIVEIVFSNTFMDSYGNKPDFSKLTPTNCNFLKDNDGGFRTGILLDGVLPAISSISPAMTGGSVSHGLNGTTSGVATAESPFKVTIVFPEKVSVEEGEIILQRKGDWAIPAVIEGTEFMQLYNKITEGSNREILMETVNGNGTGNEKTDAKTGQPVGPYKKITHGIELSGGKYVPKTNTQFVLDFQYDLYGDSSVENDKVTAIRNVLKTIDYDRHTVDVTSSNVKRTYNEANNTTTFEITFTDVIEDGREWDLIIPPKAFRDDTENFYLGMNLGKLREDEQTALDTNETKRNEIIAAADVYSIWSNKVATPVVRVDRYSHGWGAVEPYKKADNTWDYNTLSDGDRKYTKDTEPNSGRSIEPTGYVRVRIDCETPDVSIIYKKFQSGNYINVTNVNAANAKYAGSYCEGKVSTIDDIASLSFADNQKTGNYTSGSFIFVGDGSAYTASKEYVAARASKNGFTTSNDGYEGIFKTVVYTTFTETEKNHINIEGGTAPGGEPSVSGFPLRDGTSDKETSPYSKNAYHIPNTTNYVWVTYEIVSKDFSILLARNNHSSTYALNSYGQCIRITAISWEQDG